MRLVLKTKKEPEPRPLNCLNCGVAVPRESVYCGQCGQENEATPVSFAGLIGEAWEEFIKIDGKLLATIGNLMFRPGYLTREYVRGRRVAFLSPFKMYIGVSALFFLVFALLIPFDRLDNLDDRLNRLEAKANTEIKKRSTEKGATTKIADSKVASPVLPSPPPAPRISSSEFRSGLEEGFKDAGDKKVAKSKPEEPEIDKLLSGWKAFRQGNVSLGRTKFALSSLPQTVSEYRDGEERKPQAKRDGAFTHYVKERMIRFRNDPADSAKNLFSTALPFVLLIQLPLFSGWMRLLYFRQKRMYVEHLIFLLHTHSFFFLIFGLVLFADIAAQSIGTKLPMMDIPITWELLAGIVTLYNLVAFKVFYGQGWGKTLIKCWFLLNGYVLLLALTAGISAAIALIWTILLPG